MSAMAEREEEGRGEPGIHQEEEEGGGVDEEHEGPGVPKREAIDDHEAVGGLRKVMSIISWKW